MRFPVKLALVGGLATVVGIGAIFVLRTQPRVQPEEEWVRLLRDYANDLGELRQSDASAADYARLYRTWGTEFEQARAGFAPIDTPESLRTTCLSLAQGIGDLDRAESIAVEGLAHASEWTQRLLYAEHLLAIRETRAAESGLAEDMREVDATATDLLRTFETRVGEREFERDPALVLSLQRLFDTAATADARAGRPLEAAAVLKRSATFVASLPESTQLGLTTPWRADERLRRAATLEIRGGDLTQAIATLQSIDALDVQSRSADTYALLIAGDPVLPSFNEAFAREWLEANPGWTPARVRLAYARAFWLAITDLDRYANFPEVLRTLDEILTVPPDVLHEADASAAAEIIRDGRSPENWELEPVRSSIMSLYALTLQDDGRVDESRTLVDTLAIEYPKHPTLPGLQGIFD